MLKDVQYEHYVYVGTSLQYPNETNYPEKNRYSVQDKVSQKCVRRNLAGLEDERSHISSHVSQSGTGITCIRSTHRGLQRQISYNFIHEISWSSFLKHSRVAINAESKYIHM